MFGKSLLINLCAGFLLCSSNGYAAAMPVRLSATKILARELVPLVPGASIHPVHVDLMDRYENLERQVSEAVEGTPDYKYLVNDLATTKQTLDNSIKGIAVLARSDTTLSVPVPSSTVASASVTASASTISAVPSTSVNTDVPVVTVVTQIGTSVVVVASQGMTSTITLATLTNVPSSTPSSTAPPGSSTSGSASGSGVVSASSVASTTPSGTNAAQQGKASSAASPMALSMPKTQIVLGAIISTLFGALTVL